MMPFFLYASFLAVSFAYDIPTQPLRKGLDGQFELIGNTLISAQQVSFNTTISPYRLTYFMQDVSGYHGQGVYRR